MSEAVATVPQLVRVSCPLCGKMDSRFERSIEGFSLERCPCGMVFVNPRMTESDVGEQYAHTNHDELIALYARINNANRLAQYDEKIQLIESHLPGKGRILDFACAAGYFYERAIACGWDGHGAELGEWCAEAARRRGLPNMHIGWLRDLQFPDGHFDVVNASQVFEHLPDPKADLAELMRIIRPGGLLVADVPNYHTIPIKLNRDDFLLNTPPQHINYFTPKTLRRLLESSQFRVERVYTLAGLKLENVLGKRTVSETADAYFKKDDGTSSKSSGPSTSQRPGMMSRVKSLVRSAFVKPVLYDGWKVGMLLAAIARKPV
jgi:2-polyprenyl-3-methyl-5-hydroxy-6-metoxy-1,4-benzoquinol methylase